MDDMAMVLQSQGTRKGNKKMALCDRSVPKVKKSYSH